MAAPVVEHPGDRLRADERLVGERDDGGVDLAERCRARAQRGRLAVGPVGTDDDVGAAQVGLLADAVGVRAEHDDDGIERGHGEHRRQRVLDQRATVEPGQLLGAAEAAALARGEDDPADLGLGLSGARRAGHAGTPSSIRSASASSEAIELPGSRRSTCGIAACIPRVSGA